MKMQEQRAKALCVSLMIAAELLGISKGLCYRLTHEGKIPSIRLGRRILIPLDALNEMLEKNRKGVVLCHDGNEKPQTETGASIAARMDAGQPPSG